MDVGAGFVDVVEVQPSPQRGIGCERLPSNHGTRGSTRLTIDPGSANESKYSGMWERISGGIRRFMGANEFFKDRANDSTSDASCRRVSTYGPAEIREPLSINLECGTSA